MVYEESQLLIWNYHDLISSLVCIKWKCVPLHWNMGSFAVHKNEDELYCAMGQSNGCNSVIVDQLPVVAF